MYMRINFTIVEFENIMTMLRPSRKQYATLRTQKMKTHDYNGITMN